MGFNDFMDKLNAAAEKNINSMVKTYKTNYAQRRMRRF